MTLTLVDWLVIGGYFALNLAIGLYYARRARGSTTEFFLSGRNVPWWLAGTSMVATTFAADTPLVVTGMVARYGIAGNWLWWNMAASGMLTVFVYARLWRRAGVMTDVEFAELRYSGKPAAFLRGFRAALSRHPHQLHRHGLGEPRDAEDPSGHARHSMRPTRCGRCWRCCSSPPSTRRSPDCGACSSPTSCSSSLKMGMVVALAVLRGRATGGLGALEAAKFAALDAGSSAAARASPSFRPPTRAWMPAITLFVLSGRQLVGELVSRAPSPAAAATSRSGSSPREPNATACSPRCGSTSRTTRYARGRGS